MNETETIPGRRPLAARWLLAGIAAVAAFLYAWAINRDPLQSYYTAAVFSMSHSWHDFLFGALDPAGTITLDKLPGAFWVQALSVRAFGPHIWAIVLPQVIEGVLTVFVLYRPVTRLAGRRAGLVAALVFAVSPATVALNRGNISDTLLILLLVLAANSVIAAVQTGRTRSLVLAGLWVGLAFQAKMLQSWLVLPAFVVAVLLSAPGSMWRRVRQSAILLVVAVAVSLSWITAVSLVPAGDRPYVDGSGNDSLFAQVFVYNGFGRYTDQNPIQTLQRQAPANVQPTLPAPAGPARLFSGNLGRDAGWLLPLALFVAIVGIVARRRQPRGDPLRLGFVLWGLWLVVLAATFSTIAVLNAYYLAALTPAIAAILGTGVAVFRTGERAVRIMLPIAVLLTVIYAVVLIPARGTDVAGWMRPVVLGVGLVAVAAGLVAVFARRAFGVSVALALVAVLLAPSIAAAELTAHVRYAEDVPFEPADVTARVDEGRLLAAAIERALPYLRRYQAGAPDLIATQTAVIASLYIDASGQEVLPIGGVTGTMPSPTLDELRSDIRAGQFHMVLAYSLADPRIRWISQHCRDISDSAALVYYCQPSDG